MAARARNPFEYVLLDVFTDTPLQGNQLAVFADARGIDERDMQRIARELNLSESVFVFPAEAGADARVRIFTPGGELPFAGHPVLGCAIVLGRNRGQDTVTLETPGGLVPVRLRLAEEGERVASGWMVQPIPTWEAFAQEAELLAALGVERSRLPVEVYCNGPRHVLRRGPVGRTPVPPRAYRLGRGDRDQPGRRDRPTVAAVRVGGGRRRADRARRGGRFRRGRRARRAMRLISRHVAAVLLLLTAGGILAACGKSAHLGGAKTGAGSSTHVRLGLTGASAEKLAQGLNLQASDLPGFTASSKHDHETLDEKKLDHKLARCMGARAAAGDTLAEASSKSFERQYQVIHLSVSSSVSIMASPAQAAGELKAIRSDRARVCLTSFMRELLAKQAKGGASAKLVSISLGTPSAPGASGTFAWRVTANFTLHEVKIPFYIEMVGFVHGQDEVQLLSFGLPVPFPAGAEQELFSLLVARANAGGAQGSEKGVKPPPKSTVPTGPRRVQISL